MQNIFIEEIEKRDEDVEFVEAKLSGHPDTLCDTLCEKASSELSKYYLKNFGAVLHHNVDKGLIVAGKAEPKFGGGRIIEPMKIIIAGRATTKVGNVIVPVEKIIKKVIREHMMQFRYLTDYETIVEVKEGATNLKEVFKKKVSNDTSFGASHYPYSETEELVLKASKLLESDKFRKVFNYIGRDIKIMACRIHEDIELTIAAAFIDRFVKSMEDYKRLKNNLINFLEKKLGVKVNVNTLDSYEDINSIYLTVSGLSAEMGDDGQVGRSNRYNGLITPSKPMSLEAISGKNISHPGKLYQIVAYILAKRIVQKAKAELAYVKLLSKIGSPLEEPEAIHVQVAGKKYDAEKIRKIISDLFKNLKEVQKDIIFGKHF